ncbi:MAG: cyclase family protein [Conexivisphaerales archaeon]
MKVEEVIDLSLPIKSLATPVYPGYPMPLKATYTTVRDNGYYSNIWTFAEHTATHVDSPSHFVQGAETVEKLNPETFVAQGVVLDFSKSKPEHQITAQELKDKIKQSKVADKLGKGWVILFYTGYTDRAGKDDWLKHPVISTDACDEIIRLKVNAIGLDAPSPDEAPFDAHKKLLPKGIVIFENLTNLKQLLGRDFIFVGLPLPLAEGSASPVRAVAIITK